MKLETLLLTPLPQESREIRQALRLRPDDQGLWRRERIGLAHTGIGAARASQRCDELLVRHRPEQLVLLGLAGGARAGLASGDLVLVERAHSTGEDRTLDKALLQRSREAVARLNLPEIIGTSLEVPAVVHSSDEKARKGQAPGADLLDMETVSVARIAEQHGVPLAAVRVIFDDVNEDLLPVETFCDPDGRICWGPLLHYLLRHPWHIPRLMDYGARGNRAANLLSQFTAELLA